MHAIMEKREEKKNWMESESMHPVCSRGKLSEEMMEGLKKERNAGIRGPFSRTGGQRQCYYRIAAR